MKQHTLPASKLVKHQTLEFGWKTYTEDGERFRIKAKVRYDDSCGNGHNTFSITAEIDINRNGVWLDQRFGCLHDEVAKHFSKLRPLIKWHLVSTAAPLHYVANTVYHAGDRDHDGLLSGEVRQIRNGKTGQLAWILEADRELPKYVDADEPPEGVVTMRYVPWVRVGTGKPRDLDSARRTAVWPEATDEQLSLPADELTELLEDRLPALMQEFKEAVESLGLEY
jgi:hypothetical protein